MNKDEIQARIDWLRDAIKILVWLLIAIGAGVSNLYVINQLNVIFYIGIVFLIIISISLFILIIKINKSIKQLGKTI